MCQCGLGGRISITMPPPPGAMAPPAPKAFDQQTPDEQDATLHEASGTLKELAGGLALVGLGAAVGGLFFPPLEIVAAVALGVSEVMLVAAVAIDVAVAVTHPRVDNWLVVGGDVVAVGLGYLVGKVVVGSIFNALARGARNMIEREAAAETAAALPKTAQAIEEALAAEAAAVEAAQKAARQAQKEAELLRRLEEKQARKSKPPKQANPHEEAKINRIREEYEIRNDQNIAYAEDTIDGKPYEHVAHSGHKRDVDGTVAHTPVEQQQLKTHPTTVDREIAARRGEEVNSARRAHDSEVKISEDILRNTSSKSKGNIRVVSKRAVCESCSGAIEQYRILRLGIRVRVSHATIP